MANSPREESIEGQLRECSGFAERKGYSVVKTYADRALSGKKADNRPQFMQMIADSKQGLFDVAIVWKIDRFSRDKYDSVYYKNILKKNGVSVISATEPIDDSPEGQLMESIFEGFSVYYIKDLSMKVSRGMTENALKCKYNGGMLKTNHGQPPTYSFIINLLKNRRYLGEYRFQDTVVENAFTPLVEPEVFNKCQRRLAENQLRPASFKPVEEKYILTGKIFCGYCGGTMAGVSGTSSTGITCKFSATDLNYIAQKQRLIDIFVNSIYVYDDKMVVTFNYKDGDKCVTFDKINELLTKKENSDNRQGYQSSPLDVIGEPSATPTTDTLNKRCRRGGIVMFPYFIVNLVAGDVEPIKKFMTPSFLLKAS